mgnify:CR=1 FL=1
MTFLSPPLQRGVGIAEQATPSLEGGRGVIKKLSLFHNQTGLPVCQLNQPLINHFPDPFTNLKEIPIDLKVREPQHN